MSKSGRKGSGRKTESGNVVIDLGETIEKKLRSAGLSGGHTEEAGIRSNTPRKAFSYSAFQRGGYRPGIFGGYRPGIFGRSRPGIFSGYRPSMFGGYKPWYSRFGSRPWLGQGLPAAVSPRASWQIIPTELQQVKTTELLTGISLGVLGNRALVRLIPTLWQQQTKLFYDGLAFFAGLVPMLIKRNPTTMGVAVPGAVFLAGSLVDMLFDALRIPKAEGMSGASRADAAMAARQKLAAIQQRMGFAQTSQPSQPSQQQVPIQAVQQRRQVYAQPQYA